MNYPIVDIGSNTIKMTVFSQDGKMVFRTSKTVGLIGYIKNGILSESGYAILKDILVSYRSKALELSDDPFYAFATASFRSISDPQSVIERIKSETGIEIDLLSSEEESDCSFLASMSENKDDKGVIVDMGGGSTEIISYENRMKKDFVSLPFGGISLFGKFVSNIIPGKCEAEKMKKYITETVKSEATILPCDKIYVISGTMRSFVSLYDLFSKTPKKETDEGIVLEFKSIKKIYRRLLKKKLEDRIAIIEKAPERINSLFPVLCTMIVLSELYGAEYMVITSANARKGYYLKLTENQNA